MKPHWHKHNHPIIGEYYTWGNLRVLVRQEEGLWHLSISTEYRYPTWNEIHAAWYELVPQTPPIHGAIILPPESEYINLHPNCFHVYQLNVSEIPRVIAGGDEVDSEV